MCKGAGLYRFLRRRALIRKKSLWRKIGKRYRPLSRGRAWQSLAGVIAAPPRALDCTSLLRRTALAKICSPLLAVVKKSQAKPNW